MFKFLWLDTETTGLDPIEHDPIQISGIIVAGGKEQKFDFQVKPINMSAKDMEGAEKIHGISKEQMAQFPEPKKIHKQLKAFFKRYVNPYDKTDKFILAGQNVQFDCDMMHQWFKKLGDDFWFSWVGYSQFDLKNLAILYEMKHKRKIFSSYKLGNICKVLGVELGNAHDSLADIVATRKACTIIWSDIIK